MTADYTDPPEFPEGTPEYGAYRAELRTELDKFAKGEAPYEYPDTAPRMTVAEIALMREIVRWRKAHEIEFVRRRVMGTYWVDPFGRTGEPRRMVAIELREVRSLGLSPDSMSLYEWIAVESVTQAVDVLVAFGYLPARFSSAYRAGFTEGVRWGAGGRMDAGRIAALPAGHS